MLQEERFSNIIELLKINKMAKVNELAKINKVSVDTVRCDLEVLEGYGILERVRGGAVWKDANNTRNIYEVRVTVNTEKRRNCRHCRQSAGRRSDCCDGKRQHHR